MSAPTTSTTRPEMPSPTPSAKRQNSGNSVKKALATLKRRGSKLLSRRASTPGTMSTALVHSPSRSPSGSLRSRSRSPSPTPASKQRPTSMHVRARTTSFGFSLTRGLRKNSSSPGVNDAGLPSTSSPHVPNKLRKPSSLRSLRSDATTAVDSLTASSSEFGPHSPLLFKDPASPPGKDMKLSLDMSRASESSVGKMPTIYSAMPQTDDEEEPKKDLLFSEPVYEEQETEAPVAVETPETIEETAAVVDTPEPLQEAAPAIATPEPIVEEATVLAEEVPLPTDEDEDLVMVSEEDAVPAPAAEPIAEVSSTSEPEVSAPAPQEQEQLAPAPVTPLAASLVSLPSTPITAPAPLADRPASPASSASSDEEEEVIPELPALVLPTMIMPIPNVRTLLSTVMGAPFFTLHWWLHPLLPIV